VTPTRLWRVAGDFITYVQAFGAAGGSAFPPPVELRSRLIAMLEPLSRGTGVEIEEARVALICWADEVILKTSWPGHAEWLREPLQMRLLHTNKGGDLFFDRLARLRPDQIVAREIYFLVLVLGFEGQLQGAPQQRRRLMDEQYGLMRASQRLVETTREEHLTPQAYQLDVELPREAGSSFLRRMLFLSLALIAVYAALWIALALLVDDVPLPPRGL
jgi:type VI secretion system protein ImpK